MASAFASQLQAIAQKSTNELDIKARRNAHAESLLFDRAVAAKQDFDSIYSICSDGFKELCQLDSRFHDFDQNLFSEQAKVQDRDLMTKADNASLDSVLNHCLILLGSRILLKPAIKALEWLVRRFRVHIHNVDHLLCTLIPYHESQIWANVLSIVPDEKIVNQWKFIRPYLKTTWNVPRHAVAHAAANNDSFFGTLNSYVLDTCRQGPAHTALMKFWSSIIVEAVSNRLTQTRSGRREVQHQRTEDFLHKILPLLSDGFESRGSMDLITTCYTITIVLAARAELDDRIIDSLMLAVAETLNHADHDTQAVIITLAILTSHKQINLLPRKVVSTLADVEVLPIIIRRLTGEFSFSMFLTTLIASATSQIKNKTVHKLAPFLENLVSLLNDISTPEVLAVSLQPVVAKVVQLGSADMAGEEVTSQFLAKLQRLNEKEHISSALLQAATNNGQDPSQIENILGMTISLSNAHHTVDPEDVDMDDVMVQSNVVDELDAVPPEWQETSFMASAFSNMFVKLADRFQRAYSDGEELTKFTALSVWSAAADRKLLWQSFLLRFACADRSVQSRIKALQLLAEALKTHSACNLQHYTPYLLVLLMGAKPLRKTASEILSLVHGLIQSDRQNQGSLDVGQFYAPQVGSTLSPISNQQLAQILGDIVLPVIEECRLDQDYIVKTVKHALGQNPSDTKKSHKQALFNLLSQHANAAPMISVQIGILSMLTGLEKVGSKSVAKTFLPILQRWSEFTEDEAETLVNEAGISLTVADVSIAKIADAQGNDFLRQIGSSMTAEVHSYRGGFVTAFLHGIQLGWSAKTVEHQLSVAETMFDLAFSENEFLASGAQDVLKSVDLNSSCLASLMQMAQAGSTEVRGPSTKRKRRSSHGTQALDIDLTKKADVTVAKFSLALELLEGNAPETKHELVSSVFEMLASLKQLQQNRVNSPYMMNVCLNCAFGTIKSAKSVGKAIDAASVKPELVTDILRNADNPQVQNSALQLLASLSTIVPDRMVHNVMPIFTFIGHSMLSKEDDYSISVVNEAVDKIVPALLENLKKSKNAQKYQASVISMLASFTSSFEHIPAHRRVAFYQKLLQSIEVDNFGFVMLALLGIQQIDDPSFTKFVHDVLSAFGPQAQLRIYQQLIETALDIRSSTPKIAAAIFDIQKSTPTSQIQQYAMSSLRTSSAIIQAPGLSKKIQRVAKDDYNVPAQLQQALQSTLAALQPNKASDQNLVNLLKQNMDVLLQLPALSDVLDILFKSLDEMDVELRPQALRILALQFGARKANSEVVREKALHVLQKLDHYLMNKPSEALFQASLVCIDRIAEVCGRKHPEAILATAEIILRDVNLPVGDGPSKRLNSLLLTLASLVETLKETSVPLIPDIVRKALPILDTLVSNEVSYTAFNALCVLLLAVFSHAAFMVSEEDLLELFKAMVTASKLFEEDRDMSDYHSLAETLAHKVDLEILVDVALTISRGNTSEKHVREALRVASEAITRSAKSEVIKHADKVSHLFIAVLDVDSKLRQDLTTADELDNALSHQSNAATISFIYKINDTTLRPIFESWVDWATTPDSSGSTTDRQVALYSLLAHFFDTLKGIVTSYGAHLVQPLSKVLQATATGHKTQTPSERKLIEKTLALLRAIATHDQDVFFGAPSHFEPIAPHLVSLLNLASTKTSRRLVYDAVVPTIVSLATATMDNPQTHTMLSHYIVQLKSADSAQTRLASIRTLLALTEDEELGDEFVSNTVGIGAGEGEGARGGGSSVGEIMVYVNEMLEDDDEEVEHAVRSWVQLVRSKVGEDIFEV